ncbi:MAG: hypothetical protein JSR62_13495, partial [Nitrospira sp.]|nr:hypothetical protein [Nitrospira sp.]MBS1914335.1 hypothetical protein [Bacteroidota bacterium]
MRRAYVVLSLLVMLLPASSVMAGGGDGDKKNVEPLRRSDAALGSYPGGPDSKAPLSTGYYVTDNDAPQTGQPWAPNFSIDPAPLSEWHRILSGPNQRLPNFWTRPESNGYEYFRNPDDMSDSTDNAFAGPIAIGFPFYYYGRKYDSFYVSTNGLIALTNRRYQYDEQGRRVDYEPVFDDTRPRAASAAADTTPDNYGYQYVATGNTTSPIGGLRNPNNVTFPTPLLRSVIAPLWDDTELSQYDPNTGLPDDFGQVMWHRSGSSLVIYVINQSMKGSKNIPLLGTTATVQPRTLRASYQIVFNRLDSSVQINYINFRGSWVDGTRVFNIPSNTMYRSNATIGIQSHDGEFTNFLSNVDFGGAVFANGNPLGTPHDAMALMFKQWKNVVRVLSATFQTPSQFVPGKYVDLPPGSTSDNYELLLGHATLGVVRPVGIVQNVSSDVGPVNVTPQPIRFNVIFRIRDLVNVGNPPVYQRTATSDTLFPIFGSNPLTHKNVDTIRFDPYITNANVPRQAGRFRAEVIALDQAPNGSTYGEQWPFDDTTGIHVFGIRRLAMPFVSTFNNYSVSPEEGTIPSVQEWVSLGAKVADGDAACYNPPPPRGPAGDQQINSPVCLMDRRDMFDAYYRNNAPGALCGDTLVSFPINLTQSVANPVLLLSYQRSGRQQNGYPRDFSDNNRIGPEQAVYNTVKDQLLQTPDKLMVEFAEPSLDGLNGIVNIASGSWRNAGFNHAQDVINWGTTSPRWGVFGGGGGSGLDTTGKVVVDEFDAGKDFEFNRAYIPIPNHWAKAGDGSKTFRFRIRVEAKNDGNPFGAPADDGDNFYIDNVMVIEPDKPEIEVTAVHADWPYTEAPASQARAIPLSVKIGNNGATAATTFGVAMAVDNRTTPPAPGLHSYYRYQSIVSLPAGRDRVENFPAWNAQECGANIQVTPGAHASTSTDYRISARILPQNFDANNLNDVNYTDLRLTLGSTFAYDDGSNDVQNAAGLTGKGLNLIPPTTQDGNGATPYGPSGGSSSGTFAMQFRILARDTIRGFQAYFGGANQSPDFVLYSLYKQLGNPNNPPAGRPVIRAYSTRGADSDGAHRFDQYVTYLLDTPYVAEPGTYFATVAQLGQTGIELGGDASRMAQITTIVSPGPPAGVGNYSIAAHPEMRQNRFWYEVTTESGGWNPMITLTNNPGYPHLDFQGTVGPVKTFTRGSWIPMIR